MLAFAAEQASLSLTWSETPKDTFSHDEVHIFSQPGFEPKTAPEVVALETNWATSTQQIKWVFEDNLGIIFVISP